MGLIEHGGSPVTHRTKCILLCKSSCLGGLIKLRKRSAKKHPLVTDSAPLESDSKQALMTMYQALTGEVEPYFRLAPSPSSP